MKWRQLIIGLIWIIAVVALGRAISVAALTEASAPELSCAAPRREMMELCGEMQARILDTTVRIRIDSWAVREGETGYDIHTSLGHGTVMADRYLVTHNHFSTLPAIRARDEQARAYGVVTLYDHHGRERYTGPMAGFEVVWEEGGEPRLTLADGVLPGASGGGRVPAGGAYRQQQQPGGGAGRGRRGDWGVFDCGGGWGGTEGWAGAGAVRVGGGGGGELAFGGCTGVALR